MSHQDDLMQAAREGNIEKINLAISSGAKVNFPDKTGATALFIAAKHGHAEVVRVLYHQHKASLDQFDNIGYTPFLVAAFNGHLNVLELLVELGVDPKQLFTKNNATALFIAAQQGHIELIEPLVEWEVHVDAPKNTGATPIFIAAQKNHAGIIRELARLGAKVDQTSLDGTTPLFISAHEGHKEAIQALLDCGANANLKSPSETPLEIAEQKSHARIIPLLKSHLKLYPGGIKPYTLPPFSPNLQLLEKRAQALVMRLQTHMEDVPIQLEITHHALLIRLDNSESDKTWIKNMALRMTLKILFQDDYMSKQNEIRISLNKITREHIKKIDTAFSNQEMNLLQLKDNIRGEQKSSSAQPTPSLGQEGMEMLQEAVTLLRGIYPEIVDETPLPNSDDEQETQSSSSAQLQTPISKTASPKTYASSSGRLFPPATQSVSSSPSSAGFQEKILAELQRLNELGISNQKGIELLMKVQMPR